MSWLDLPWPGRGVPRPGDPSIREDLRSGRAGVPVRIGLSLAAATVLFAMVMFSMGMIDRFGRVQAEHVATALGLAGAAWCGILVVVWSSYPRWRRLIQTIFIVLGIWLVTIPMCVLIGETLRSAEFLIAGCIFLGISATIVTVSANAYYAWAGRAIEDRQGKIVVECPECNYSMVGLEGCKCPECGKSFTIDELIREQNYAALRPASNPAPIAQLPEAPHGATELPRLAK